MVEHDPYRESLDDPSLPFEFRWALINEIDSTNQRFRIYRMFLKEWERMLAASGADSAEAFSVFEIGSGSGGLSREIARWARKRGFRPDLHLYDSQRDILNESLGNFDKDSLPTVHVATEDYLAAFPDNAFDFVISLHVVHHIRPFDEAVTALRHMLRIARKGVLIMDFENKPWAVPFAKVWNRVTGVSAELSSDGIKSLRRAYDGRELIHALDSTRIDPAYVLQLRRLHFVPYWLIRASRAG